MVHLESGTQSPKMNNSTDAILIRQCTQLIEENWQRGPSGEWKNYDFEKLSDDIFDATGISLSISTLKRLFGKVSYNNLPSAITLNTLARFAGFEDWNAFKRREVISMAQEKVGGSVPQETQRAVSTIEMFKNRFSNATAPKKKYYWWPFLILPLAGLAYVFVNSTKPPRQSIINPSSYSFSSNKVLTEGVPNSVVFHYDASASPSDSVFIVQTWDMKKENSLVSQNRSRTFGYLLLSRIFQCQTGHRHTGRANPWSPDCFGRMACNGRGRSRTFLF